jgi:hypothetical protein
LGNFRRVGYVACGVRGGSAGRRNRVVCQRRPGKVALELEPPGGVEMRR